MTRLPLPRRARAVSLVTLAAVATMAGPLGTARAASPAVGSPGVTPDARIVAPQRTPQPGTARAAQPAALQPAAGGLTQLPAGQECAPGLSRATTLLSEGFESGVVPEATYSKGWSIQSSGARTGSRFARSYIGGSTQPTAAQPYFPLGLPFVQAGGGRTMLRFAIKGSYPANAATVSVNAESGSIGQTSTWGVVTLDITGAIQPSDAGAVDIRFANYPETLPASSTIDLDDVEVYTCAGASGVRGDFTGDGIADVVTLDNAGKLQIWPGDGAFHVGSPRTALTGLTDINWMASPGDYNADQRADLITRNTKGDLRVWYGDGAGGFSSSRLIGTAWYDMTSIIPMNDLDGDGKVDLLARNTAGDLRRYWLSSPGGNLTGWSLVGTGFQNFTNLMTAEDFDGDGRWDVTGILQNGDMKVYTTLKSGSLWGHGQRIGNGWFFRSVSSPGDYNRDGHSDVVGFTPDGNIRTYPVLGGGKWGQWVLTGSGFGGFKLVM